uniref:Uncharacterized protein n=1 Tax=Aegilops tauschii TaxID=37682 RepID=M8BY66_AEGTA
MDGADVTFHVGGDKFPAHRSVLATRSSVFKAELLGSMKENASDPLVEIKDMDSDVFKSLLHFIYTDDSPSEMACEYAAMVASDGYEHLKSSCPSVLKELIARFLPAELKAAKDIIMKF